MIHFTIVTIQYILPAAPQPLNIYVSLWKRLRLINSPERVVSNLYFYVNYVRCSGRYLYFKWAACYWLHFYRQNLFRFSLRKSARSWKSITGTATDYRVDRLTMATFLHTFSRIGFFRPSLLRVGCSPSSCIYPVNSCYVAPSTPYPYSKTTQPLCPSLWVLVTFHHRWAESATVRRIDMHLSIDIVGHRMSLGIDRS